MIAAAALALALATPAEDFTITFDVPKRHVVGREFPVSLSIAVGENGADVPSALFSSAAIRIDGEPVAARQLDMMVSLEPGTKLSLQYDLAPHLGEVGESFQIGLVHQADQPDREVPVLRGAPAGLNFTEMAAEELAKYEVVLLTNQGDIRLKFWPDIAPNHVRNFLDLSYTGFYDGSQFHRVIPGFMVQGGQPGTPGQRAPRTLNREWSDRKHVRGVLSAARLPGQPDSATSEFFIMQRPAPHLDGEYSAYGEAILGLDVVDKIVSVPRNRQNRPNEPQVIEAALVVPAAE